MESSNSSLRWDNWANLNPQQRLNVAVSMAIQNSPMCKAIHDNGYKKDFTYAVGFHENMPRGGGHTNIVITEKINKRVKLVVDVEGSPNAFNSASFVSHEQVHVSTVSHRIVGINHLHERVFLPENRVAYGMIEEAVAYNLQSEFDVRFLAHNRENADNLYDEECFPLHLINYLAVVHDKPQKHDLFAEKDVFYGFLRETFEMTNMDKERRSEIRMASIKDFLVPYSGLGNIDGEYNRLYLKSFIKNVSDNIKVAQNSVSSGMIPKKWSLNVDDITSLYTWGDKQFLSKDQWNETFEGMNPVSFVRRGIRNAGLSDEYNRSIGAAAKYVGLPFNPV